MMRVAHPGHPRRRAPRRRVGAQTCSPDDANGRRVGRCQNGWRCCRCYARGPARSDRRTSRSGVARSRSRTPRWRRRQMFMTAGLLPDVCAPSARSSGRVAACTTARPHAPRHPSAPLDAPVPRGTIPAPGTAPPRGEARAPPPASTLPRRRAASTQGSVCCRAAGGPAAATARSIGHEPGSGNPPSPASRPGRAGGAGPSSRFLRLADAQEGIRGTGTPPERRSPPPAAERPHPRRRCTPRGAVQRRAGSGGGSPARRRRSARATVRP